MNTARNGVRVMTSLRIDDKLGDVLRRQPGQLHAVIDGAYFGNLPERLALAGIQGAPLYMDETELPAPARGPHLVLCPSIFAMEQVRDVCGGLPATVWWAWPHGSEALWRHLKRLNLVEIPAHRDEPIVGRRQIGAINRAAKTETVVFRHGDPHVIRLLMPILSPVQKALLFGGAAAIIADTGESDPPLVARNPAPSQPAPFGRLHLSDAQHDELSGIYGRGLRRRAVNEFRARATVSDQVLMNDADLERISLPTAERITRAYDRAERYGCVTKAQIWEFITLDLRYGEGFELAEGCEKVRAALTLRDSSPEERLSRAEMELDFLSLPRHPLPPGARL